MKILIAAAILFGTTVSMTAAELGSDYRSYIGSESTATGRVKPGHSSGATYSVQDVDARRPDEGSAIKHPDPLRPGFRNRAGMYVPPDYSTHPRGTQYDGFGSSARDSEGGYGSLNPFGGGLGTRR